MKVFAIILSAFAITVIAEDSLIPECASSCAYVLDQAGCGPLNESSMNCFCENKDKVIGEAQACLMNSRRCSLRELLSIRSRIIDRCGSF
jgi:hypothetical protein